jgi:hypothetical protein
MEEIRPMGFICHQHYKGSCWQCRKIENKRKRSFAGLDHKAKQTKCISGMLKKIKEKKQGIKTRTNKL